MSTNRMRSLGGVAGILAAVAGGLGAAVGFYDLPDPAGFGVGASAYVRADQRAIAVVTTGDCSVACSTLRIDTGRGGSAGEDANHGGPAPGVPQVLGEEDVNGFFSAWLETCTPKECFVQGGWESRTVLEGLTLDPLLESARFTGEVGGCFFDVTWEGGGIAAPFAGVPGASAGAGPWHANARFDNASLDVSRQATADIEMSPQYEGACEAASYMDAPGYLAQGVRRVNAGAGGQT